VSSLSALLASGNDANNKNISDLADPENDSDMATLGFALQVISGEYSEEKQLIFTIGYDGSWNSEVIPLWKTPLGKRVDILEVSAYAIGNDIPELKYKLELRPESSLSESGSNLFDYSIANQEGDEKTSFTGGNGILGENHLVLVTSTTGALVSGFVNSLTLVIVYKERY
jgi:hypothetical protein